MHTYAQTKEIYRDLKGMTGKAELVSEEAIRNDLGNRAFESLRHHGFIECCAVIQGKKMYAIQREELTMTHRGLLEHADETKRETFEELKEEYDAIKRDMDIVTNMKISEELKPPILADRQQQINEVKERMHNYIDRLQRRELR